MNTAPIRCLLVLAATALLGAADARPSTILTYTGDANGLVAYGNYHDLSGTVNIPESQVFQSFNVAAGSTWIVNSMYVNETDLGPSNVTQATWSIRTGMGPGQAGMVLFSGTSAATEGAGAISQITVDGLNITLPPGQYWVNVTPLTNGTKLLADATSGLNSINATLLKSGLWYESQYQNYTPVMTDFSVGITGSIAVATPEPASWLMMTAALMGCAVFLRTRNAAALKPVLIAVRAVRSNPRSRR